MKKSLILLLGVISVLASCDKEQKTASYSLCYSYDSYEQKEELTTEQVTEIYNSSAQYMIDLGEYGFETKYYNLKNEEAQLDSTTKILMTTQNSYDCVVSMFTTYASGDFDGKYYASAGNWFNENGKISTAESDGYSYNLPTALSVIKKAGLSNFLSSDILYCFTLENGDYFLESHKGVNTSSESRKRYIISSVTKEVLFYTTATFNKGTMTEYSDTIFTTKIDLSLPNWAKL